MSRHTHTHTHGCVCVCVCVGGRALCIALSHPRSCSETVGRYQQTCPEANESTCLLYESVCVWAYVCVCVCVCVCECVCVCVCVYSTQLSSKGTHMSTSNNQSIAVNATTVFTLFYFNFTPKPKCFSFSQPIQQAMSASWSSKRINMSEGNEWHYWTTRCVHEGLMRLLLSHWFPGENVNVFIIHSSKVYACRVKLQKRPFIVWDTQRELLMGYQSWHIEQEGG